MNNNLLTGISLSDNTPFEDWATNILPWLREAMNDVAEGITGDIATLLDKQQRYTAYAGALVEIYAKAEAYYKTKLAEAMEAAIKEGVSASLVARIAEGKIATVIRFYEAIHRFNSTLTDQLMAVAARLKYEGALMWGDRGGQEKPK
ncbi:MAG: hypothetical protein GXY86_08830 [Firmicutes bacterium]|nr:hypothetical protein [Bacillota bacterium]